jgi:hypothetical protein
MRTLLHQYYNKRKDGCFKVVLLEQSRGLVFFRRKNGEYELSIIPEPYYSSSGFMDAR